MLYLEEVLTKEEEIIYLNWLFYLSLRPEDLCGLQATERAGRYIIDLPTLDNMLSVRVPNHMPDRKVETILKTIETTYHKNIAQIIEKIIRHKGRRGVRDDIG